MPVTACAACPYLGKRSGSQNHLWFEFTSEERQHGMGPNVDILKNQTDLWGTVMGAMLACYKGVDLEGEFKAAHRDGGGIADYGAATRDFIQTERDCDFTFTLLSPSLGAEKHLQAERAEMLEAQRLAIAELEQRSQASILAIAEEMKKSAEATARTSAALLDVTNATNRSNAKYTVAFLILAFLGSLQALGLAYPNGIAWLVDRAPGQPRIVASATATPQSTPSTSAGPLTPVPAASPGR